MLKPNFSKVPDPETASSASDIKVWVIRKQYVLSLNSGIRNSRCSGPKANKMANNSLFSKLKITKIIKREE